MMLTQARLKEVASYNPTTGVFTRIEPLKGQIVGSNMGSKNNDGYISISIDYKRTQAHRLAWLYVHGRFPVNQLDHINGIKDDNRLENLREVTQEENQLNKGLDKRNKFGHPGIRLGKKPGSYRAYIGFNKIKET